jgi:hypothetical protein
MDFGSNEFEKLNQNDIEKKLLVPQLEDRCVAMNNGTLMKGRIVSDLNGAYGVMFVKKGPVSVYNRNEIFLIYRYIDTPMGPETATVPLCLLRTQNV